MMRQKQFFNRKKKTEIVKKVKQFLAALLVVFSTFIYAQLPVPTLLSSQRYSAFGAGLSGMPATMNFNVPAGNDRVMVIYIGTERYHNPAYGNGVHSLSYVSFPIPAVNGINTNATGIAGSHADNGTSPPVDFQKWEVYYKLSDAEGLPTGNVVIDFPNNLKLPQSIHDEIIVMVAVYSNVKNVATVNLVSGGYSSTGSAPAIPVGRTATELLYSSYFNTTQDTGLSLSAGWTMAQNYRITNNTGNVATFPINPASPNEHDGFSAILGHNRFSGNPSVTITRTGTGSVYSTSLRQFAFLPFASPGIAGNVYRDTTGSSTIEGSATNAGGTYVNVIDDNNNLIYSATVNSATGTFTIPTGYVLQDSTYRLELSKNTGTIGAVAPLKQLPNSWATIGESNAVSPYPNDGANDGTINLTIGTTNISELRYGINICAAGTTAPPVQSITNVCPVTTVNLTTAHTGTVPAGSSLVWYTNNAHTGTALSGTQVTAAVAGTYYAFYYDSTGDCYSNASNAVEVNIIGCYTCLPNPYSAQQTWWIPNSFSNEVVRVDFQTGSAVLNNPATGFLGQGDSGLGFEGNTAVTHPVTGALLFVTDGNKLFKGSTGVLASGPLVGGNGSAEEAAGVIPDPQGVLGRDFIIFGNATANSPGTLRSAKYNLETNTISNVTTLLPASSIYEGLEVIPHTNGTDYWILVNTTDQKVKTYLYSKASGFNATAVSTTDVANLAGVDPTYIAVESFISWDPRNPGKVLIARHNKVGLANFNPATGVLGVWDVKVTVTSGTVDDNANTGYSAALSPNGRYIYYVEYVDASNTQVLKYHDLTTGTITTLDGTVGPPTGIKIAPDGKLYRTGYAGSINQLYYINANANTPPAAAGSQVFFPTGGRELGLQLPNNTYWACATCQSGTSAPALASTNITSSPATVGDLIALLSASNQPAGTVITIHSGATATDANKLANSTPVVAGTTYYASFFDGLAICYSPTTAVSLAITAFTCSPTLYLSQYPMATAATLYSLNSSTNPFTITAIGNNSHGIQYNAIGYNTQDNFIYGLPQGAASGRNHLIKIGNGGNAFDLGVITGLPDIIFNAGDMDSGNNLYALKVSGDNVLYKINTTNLTATATTLSQSVTTLDFAFDPTTGKIFGFDNVLDRMYSIDPTTGAVTYIGGTQSYGSYGAMFSDNLGNVYGNANNGSGFYQFNKTTGARTLISSSISSTGNDGAHCSSSPISFEADLDVTKTDSKTQYVPGTTNTYTIVVTNIGPFGVLGASVSDLVPVGIPAANVTYTAIASTGSSTNVLGTQIGAISDLVSLPVGGTVTYTVNILIPVSFAGDLINTVIVTPPAATSDSTPANNSATDTDMGAVCYKPGILDAGNTYPTKHGITALGRAGTDNENWPMTRQSAWTVLESKEKGFVVNRVATTAGLANITNPVEGMMVYDEQADCLKIYTLKSGDTVMGWHCFITPACPD